MAQCGLVFILFKFHPTGNKIRLTKDKKPDKTNGRKCRQNLKTKPLQ